MRISHTPRAYFGLLCVLFVSMLVTGCGSPSSQNLASLTVTATPSTISVGGASVLKAVAHLSDGTTQDVTAGTQWTLSNTSMGTVSNGTFSAKAAGSVTVQAAYVESAPAGTSPAATTVTPQDLSASTQVTITAAGTSNVPTITWNAPAAITYGAALSSTQLNAKANVAGTFAYTPAAGTVLKAGTQTLSVTFTPTDIKTYSAATASVKLTVNQASPTITWATPAAITTGTALSATQLDATANVPGTFMYNPAVATVLSAGTQQLTAVFSPSDTTDYSSATAHTSLTVGPVSGPVPPTPPPPTIGPGTIYPISAGASTATIQSTINTAAAGSGGSIVSFAAGTYSITSQLSIPCPASPLIISGPATRYPGPGPFTGVGPFGATLNSSVTGTWMMTLPSGGCTNAITVTNLNLNGGQPSPDGGGLIYFPTSGGSNITITNNYLHGNSANACSTSVGPPACVTANLTKPYDSLIWMDGGPGGNTWSNVKISWNAFGAATDCNSVMTSLFYQGTAYNGPVGLCAGVGVHTNTNNFLLSNNSLYHMEQGFKFYEGNQTAPFYTCGATNNPTCFTVQNNDFSNIHRNPIEGQMVNMTITGNSVHDQSSPGDASWGFSLPQLNCNIVTNNLMIASTAAIDYWPGAFEYWGSCNASTNLIQGNWGTASNGAHSGAIEWGFNGNQAPYTGPATVSNNIIQVVSGQQVVDEGYGAPAPTITGNVTATTVSAITSKTPTISPAASTGTFPLTITLTDAGDTSGTGPQGNTGIWYTTDGSTPVPGAGTAQYASTGGTIVLIGPATVKAVGMWGALNQPRSYTSGYGFVPSTVVTASYTANSSARPTAAPRISSSHGETLAAPGAAVDSTQQSGAITPALESVEIVPAQPAVVIGSKTQLKAIASFDDGSTKDVTADFTWTSSDPRTMGASTTGALEGLAGGKAVISGSYQGYQASVPASSTIGEVQWDGPIVVTKGGTYSGNWQSNDSQTPAVTISTTDPVIVENSHIRSVGSLIKAGSSGSDLTVRNSVAVAMNSNAKGQPSGVFLEAASPARLDVENNYVENASSGIVVHGYSGNRDGKQTIVIRANRARNLNGLVSDGSGGYLPAEGSNHSVSRFIELDNLQAVPGVDIGWNEVINYPGRSLVSDNIDVNRSSGTPNQPLEIHDTYIQGAYPYRAAQDAYTGGGIKTEGSLGDGPQEATAFSNIHDNQVIGTVGYGIEFTAGHDNIAFNNRVISSGLLADGTRIAAQHVGMANGVVNGASAPNRSMYNNTMRDNVIGWTCWTSPCDQQGYRKDQYFPVSPGDYSNNSLLPARPITLNMEDSEYQVWLNKMVSAGITVGPSF